MKKLLYILRHAKAEIAADYADDHARPLAERGLNDAKSLGERLRSMKNPPQQILCSTAKRTRETHSSLALDVPVAFSERLYLASTGELLTIINTLPETVESVMLIGHNPGMHELTALLTHHAKNEDDTEQLREHFPTCTLAILSFPTEWNAITPDTGLLEQFIIPKRG